MAKELTDKQKKFLDVLFEEAGGNITKAKKLAGYSKNTRSKDSISGMKEEIIAKTREYLAINGPKAAVSLIGILSDPTAMGNKDKLAAARDLLDRIGLKSSDKVEVTTKSPIFIMPSKD